MIAELIKQGYFKEIVSEGTTIKVLKSPVQIVVKADVLKRLDSIYPLHEETGGILYAYPVDGNLIVTAFTVLPNNLTGDARKTAYQPINSNAERQRAIDSGALPIRFHSHPVEIFENPYDGQPLQWFQKTSIADRHNSYMPIYLDGYTVVLPDALLTANDRLGNDIRLYFYGGFVAPDSLKALLSNEKIYIYFVMIVAFLTYLFGGFKRSLSIFLLSALLSVIVFVFEKRPTGVKNSDGDLVISIP